MHAFRAMNADFHTYGLDEMKQSQAESWFTFAENHLSRFRLGSELARFSRGDGSPFLASPLLYEAVFTANRYYEETGGLFNPYLASSLSELGYNVSFEHIHPPEHKSESTTEKYTRFNIPPSRPRVHFNPLLKSILLERGAAMDLGGIAKGWSAERLSAIFRREGVTSGAIDAGGDIIVWGGDSTLQTVFIADPLNEGQDLMRLKLSGVTGIATSSRLKRSWTDNKGTRLHHIIDPRTLRPSQSDLVQVTVWGPSLTAAEVYAKCVLILGSDQGQSWLEQNHPQYSAIGVSGNGRMMAAGSIDPVLH